MTGPGRLSAQTAARELTAWLTSQLPELPADRAQVLIEQACGRCPGVLLEYVRARPAALADPGPRPPLAAVRLAHALHRDGQAGIALPRCARCGRSPARFPTTRPEGRICASCAGQDRRQACVQCGRDRPAHARCADGPVCGTCYTRPSRLCEACGQQRPLARRARPGGLAVCDRCAGQARVGTCISCGRERPVLLRRADGMTYCKTCYPRAARNCARCGRLRPERRVADRTGLRQLLHLRPEAPSTMHPLRAARRPRRRRRSAASVRALRRLGWPGVHLPRLRRPGHA